MRKLMDTDGDYVLLLESVSIAASNYCLSRDGLTSCATYKELVMALAELNKEIKYEDD
tara:strand:- start:445 stop:618 length:174 start_codon:yes stop_codon:yes gene_type:complete